MASQRTALVIEDEQEVARFFELVLQRSGFAVETAHNGRTALDRLAKVLPDLVILDLNIPSVSGVEILRHMRADSSLAQIPVIVATANPQMAEDVYDLAELVLLKPVSYDQLHNLIQRFA